MAQSASSSPSPIQPLSIGNVVTTGFQLYRSKARLFLKISLYATLWILVPFFAALLVVLFFGLTQTSYYALLALLIPALLVALVYCSAQYLTKSALIARLAYGELANQPESLKDAQRFTNARRWSFLFTGLLVGLIFLGVLVAFYLAIAIVAIVLISAGGGFSAITGGNPNLGLLAILGLLFVLFLLAVLVLICWLGARLAAVEVPLAVEPEMTATGTIGRMWDLTRGNAWRVVMILFITTCVTLPIQLLVQFLVNGLQAGVEVLMPARSSSMALIQVLTLLGSYILSFGLGVVLLPLWQSIKAAIYFDLRRRREGLGLQLRDR